MSSATVRADAAGIVSEEPSRRLWRRFRLLIGCKAAGAGDVFGKPHPRLRQSQPKYLVVLVIRSLSHCHTFFRKLPMISILMVLSDPHYAIPD